MKNTVKAKLGIFILSAPLFTELLVDCAWIHQHLECIEQEGFKCNQSVSDTALINVPYRYTNRSGTYRCALEDVKSCSCSKSQLGQQSEAQVKKEKEKQEDTTQNNLDTNHSVPIGKPEFFLYSLIVLINQ